MERIFVAALIFTYCYGHNGRKYAIVNEFNKVQEFNFQYFPSIITNVMICCALCHDNTYKLNA